MNHLKKGSPKKRKWMDCYQEAKAFYEEHGRFPSRRENPRLHVWAMQWWYGKETGKSQERARMLEEIGFVYHNKVKYSDECWQRNYEKLKAFCEEHGHFPSWSENKSLHRWAYSWCSRYGKENPEKNLKKAQMLQSIGLSIVVIPSDCKVKIKLPVSK